MVEDEESLIFKAMLERVSPPPPLSLALSFSPLLGPCAI